MPAPLMTDCNSKISARAFGTPGASRYINHSEHFLKKARRGGTETPGPKFLKIGTRVVYLREDLDAWLDQFRPGMEALPKDPATQEQVA